MLLEDVRYALRTARRTSGLTAVVMVTLALGIGATAAIFSVVDAVLLRKLPFGDVDRLTRIYSDTPADGVDRYFVNEGDLTDWRSRTATFDQIAALWATEFSLRVDGGEPERVRAAAATANLFATLGLEPVLGRGFTREEDSPGGPSVALLGHGLWRRRFAGDPSVLGRRIELQNRPYTVVGVLPAGLGLIEGTEVWIPQPIRTGTRGPRYLDVIGRLKPGVSLELARSELVSVARQLEQEHPRTNKGWTVVAVPLTEAFFGDARTPLLMLLGAVSLMLLIACANIANLLLARAESRHHEFAVRAALGAGAWRLARQLLVESLALALAGGGLGVLLAYWFVAAAPAFAPRGIPRLDEVSIDARVLAFTFVVSVLTGLLFGCAPLLRVVRGRQALAAAGTRTTAGLPSRRIRAFLVVSEVAFAVVLVNGAALLIQSFTRLLDVDPGFRAENVITADVGLPIETYKEPHQVADFYSRLLGRLSSEPGVTAAGVTTSLPLRKDVDFRLRFAIAGRPQPANPDDQSAFFRMVSAGYFRSMGMRLVAGRDFTPADDAQAPGVAVINEALARRYWPNETPTDQQLGTFAGAFGPLGYTLSKEPRIVGVVADVRQTGLDDSADPAIYFPYPQAPFRAMTVVVRSSADAAGFANTLRRNVRALDDSLPISGVATLEQTMSAAVAPPRFRTVLVSAFAVLAIVLAAVGIYGVTAYTITQRVREIGVRVALGAQPGDVMRMLVTWILGILSIGIAAGTLGAIGAGRAMASLLFGIETPHAPTLVAVPLLFAAIAVTACLLAGRAALAIDPVRALRAE